MERRIIYLDNNATTRVAPEVVEAMLPYFGEWYGNPSSIHRFGGQVAAHIEAARRQVAELLGAEYRDRDGSATEIIFTSCGTEGDNAAIHAALRALPERRKIVTTAVEHPAVLHYCEELAAQAKRTRALSLMTFWTSPFSPSCSAFLAHVFITF